MLFKPRAVQVAAVVAIPYDVIMLLVIFCIFKHITKIRIKNEIKKYVITI